MLLYDNSDVKQDNLKSQIREFTECYNIYETKMIVLLHECDVIIYRKKNLMIL